MGAPRSHLVSTPLSPHLVSCALSQAVSAGGHGGPVQREWPGRSRAGSGALPRPRAPELPILPVLPELPVAGATYPLPCRMDGWGLIAGVSQNQKSFANFAFFAVKKKHHPFALIRVHSRFLLAFLAPWRLKPACGSPVTPPGGVTGAARPTSSPSRPVRVS